MQETNGYFGFITILSFSAVSLSLWENMLSTAVFALSNGGPAGLVWGYLTCMIGFGFVTASLAEMASIAPTSGAQYHWVSEFAPKNYRRLLSYLTGWLGVLSWHAAAAFATYRAGRQISALIVLWNPSHVPEAWHNMLIIWAVLTLSLLCNLHCSGCIPFVQGFVVIVHLAGFVIVVVTLWILGDTNSSANVFTSFEDRMGWGSVPLSSMIGLTGAASCFLRVEAPAHMSVETHRASRVIPRAMIWTWLGNGMLGFIMAITFSYCVKDTQSVLTAPLGSQQVQVFLNTTGSKALATALTCITLCVEIFACVVNVAMSSLQLTAFARDKGVPFSGTIALVSRKRDMRLHPMHLTVAFVLLLSLITLGSATAFQQVGALSVTAMLSTYIIAISCVASFRVWSEEVPSRSFWLGKLGLPTNIVAILFLVVVWVIAFFPIAPEPRLADMNLAILCLGSVVLLATIYYRLYGRYAYITPVTTEWKREQTGAA